jgi:uncharacterized protein (DUF433 family)
MMTKTTHSMLELGDGIYTVADIATILQLPSSKVRRWLASYWNQYSWTIDRSVAVNFQALVEFYVLYHLGEAGIKTAEVIRAKAALTEWFNVPFPFAQKKVVENIRTDRYRIYLELDGHIVSLDGTKQLNLEFIRQFFLKLDFDNASIALRFWPRGKEKSIVVDPQHQFGHPVISKTNVYPETIFGLYQGGETIPFICSAYNLTEKDVNDAIEYCTAA